MVGGILTLAQARKSLCIIHDHPANQQIILLKPPEMMDSKSKSFRKLSSHLPDLCSSVNQKICLGSIWWIFETTERVSLATRVSFGWRYACDLLLEFPIVGQYEATHQTQKTQPNTKVEHPLNHTQLSNSYHLALKITLSYRSRKTIKKTIKVAEFTWSKAKV